MENSNIYSNPESSQVDSHTYELSSVEANTETFAQPESLISDTRTYPEPLELRVKRLESQLADLIRRFEGHSH